MDNVLFFAGKMRAQPRKSQMARMKTGRRNRGYRKLPHNVLREFTKKEVPFAELT